jgi:type IV pilus assembly protein PilW
MRCRGERGVGLIEIMISLVLGMVVVGAASVIFIATRSANRTSDNLSRMQESVRTAYEIMAREVRETGGTPCDANATSVNVLTAAQTAPLPWWADWTEPVRGFDGDVAFAAVSTGAGTGERVAGTDAISVKYVGELQGLAVAVHTTATATMTTNRANTGVAVGDVLMACDYKQAALFQATAVDNAAGSLVHAQGSGNCTTGLALPVDPTGKAIPLVCASNAAYAYAAGAQLGRLVSAGWYIGNNGRTDGGGRSLYRVSRTAAGTTTQEIADGVRNMQITYLEVVDNVPAAAYVTATAVTNWADVAGVRIELTLQSADIGVGTSPTTTARLERPVDFNLTLRNRTR